MNEINRIFIIGHMGAGKSLLCKTLSQRLGWEYVDANLGLERYYGRRLQEIIGREGEEAYHQCEAELISHYSGKERVAITLEDGVIATEKNRKLLSSEYVIYLKVSTLTQIERMSDGQSPLFPITDQKNFLNELHHERDHLFEEVANLIVESVSIEQDVNIVMEALKI